MTKTNALVVCLVGMVALTLLTGCPSLPWERTGNQGGSSPVSAAAKLAQNRLDTLNPDDVQVLSDVVITASGKNIPEVTDEQAAAVVEFLSDNDLVTIQDVQALIAKAKRDPSVVEISPEVQDVIENVLANADAYTAALGVQP